jgi:hypothetical protein
MLEASAVLEYSVKAGPQDWQGGGKVVDLLLVGKKKER